MLMVIFGAGASYDSYPSLQPQSGIQFAKGLYDDVRPPLASQLFSDREAFAKVASDFRDCQPIIPFVRDVPPPNSVEQILEGLQSEAGKDPRLCAQLAAVRHYLQFIIWECESEWRKVHKGVTNFHTLFHEIEGWRSKQNESVCLVTFNYDTMIEQALPSVGVKIAEMGDYISQNYILIKPHGSVNWGRAVDNVHVRMENVNEWAVAKTLIDSAYFLWPRNEFQIVTSRPIGKSDRGPLIPALAIPIVQKQEYECPKEHLDMLDKCIPEVTKLLVVGWRASEKIFLQRLAKYLKHELQVMVVSGSAVDAEETISNLAVVRMRVIGGYKKAAEGFSHFILGRSVQGFLRS